TSSSPSSRPSARSPAGSPTRPTSTAHFLQRIISGTDSQHHEPVAASSACYAPHRGCSTKYEPEAARGVVCPQQRLDVAQGSPSAKRPTHHSQHRLAHRGE